MQKNGKIDFSKGSKHVFTTTHVESDINIDRTDLPQEALKILNKFLPKEEINMSQNYSRNKTDHNVPHQFQKNQTPSYFPENPYQSELQKQSGSKSLFIVVVVMLFILGAGAFLLLM